MTARLSLIVRSPSPTVSTFRERLFRLLGDVTGRQCGTLAEEEILHVLGHEVLRLFLPRHQAILIEDHLHTILPQLPGVGGNAVKDALTELTRPGNFVKARQLFLELDAKNR